MLLQKANIYRIVCSSIGLLLIVAAILKVDGFRVSAMPSVGWFDLPIVQSAVVVWELFLGGLLVSGSLRIPSHFLALITFFAFGVVSACSDFRTSHHAADSEGSKPVLGIPLQ